MYVCVAKWLSLFACIKIVSPDIFNVYVHYTCVHVVLHVHKIEKLEKNAWVRDKAT